LTAVQRPRPDRRPADADAAADVRTYHGTPVLQEPAWTWEVPWYLFTGGLAGASSALRVVARATGHEELARRVGWVAFASSLANPVLLVKDLGRPARFLHMLRVLRPSSAMSVGSWTLAAYSTAAGAETILGLSGRLPRVRGALALAEGAMGLPMSTYTGVLVADSSIPVWHEARHDLPLLFAASAAASAGAAASLVAPAGDRTPPRRLAVGAALMEIAIARRMARRLGAVGAVYTEGTAGRLEKVATVCATTGAVLMAAGRRSRVAGAVGATLILTGSLSQRWSVFRAGFQSARDPRTLVHLQTVRAGARGRLGGETGR
jgi:formate-dependent nitrite reductase membrane component NrfD